MTSASETQVSASQGAEEEQLLLEAARSRILRRLGSTLRHDLTSPLQAAVWAFDLVERGLASHPDPEQRTKLATSVELGRRELARLQKAVRLFVACAAPLDELPESFDLREVLGEVESLVGANASLCDVQMEFPPPAQLLGVNAVRYQIQQALLLLTLEALDATTAGGLVQVRAAAEGPFVEVQVSRPRDGPGPVASPQADLAGRVVNAVALMHGGEVTRRDSAQRHEVRFTIARMRAG